MCGCTYSTLTHTSTYWVKSCGQVHVNVSLDCCVYELINENILDVYVTASLSLDILYLQFLIILLTLSTYSPENGFIPFQQCPYVEGEYSKLFILLLKLRYFISKLCSV